jgi:hypothetical protein
MIAWGRRVSEEFRRRMIDIAIDLDIPVDYLMACIAWESGRTFRPDMKNMAGSGATGLIQFMPKTARALGTTTESLAKMSAEDQLFYVHKYFAPYRGKLKTLEDVYMAILWPAAIGKPYDYVLFNRLSKPTTYRQNAGLDYNKDGNITKWEACAKVRAELDRGFEPENADER